MHIAELAQRIQPYTLYRCDTMPPNRAMVRLFDGRQFYCRPDGTIEPFDFAKAFQDYKNDETWEAIGQALPLPSSIEVDPASLAIIGDA